jgi:thiol-disulfide isomerase/thioredoxin
MKMRGLVIVLGSLLCLGTVSAAKLEDPSTGRTVTVEPGAPALHVVFFATWCSTCVEELPDLADLEARWKGQGYQLELVAVRTRQDVQRLKEFADEERPPGRLLFDATGQAEASWKASRLPTHVVFDAAGREVSRSSGLDEKIRSAIADLLDARRAKPKGRPR